MFYIVMVSGGGIPCFTADVMANKELTFNSYQTESYEKMTRLSILGLK